MTHVLAFLVLISSLTLTVEINGSPTQRPKFTLDPDTLAKVKELLKATTESPPPDFAIRFGGSQKIVFHESEQDFNTKILDSSVKNKEIEEKCSSSRKRRYRPDGKCYTVGSYGPCGTNMLFYALHEDQIYGDCDCKFNSEVPLVYHPESSSCSPIYEQAYCRTGQWLILDRSSGPICEERKCPPDPEDTIVPFKGRCVKLGEWDKDCGALEIVVFKGRSTQPSCGHIEDAEQSIFDIPVLKCASGESAGLDRKCRRKFNFRKPSKGK